MGRKEGFACPSSAPSRGGAILLFVLAVVAQGTGLARAQQASGYVELTAGRSNESTEDAGAGRTESQSDAFLQRYSLDVVWRLYPNFQMLVGGIFERDSVTQEQELGTNSTTQRKIHPYLSAALQTAITSATFAYYRNQDELKTRGLSINNIQEIYNASLSWKPEDLPSLLLRFIRTNDFDSDRRARDTTTDSFDLVSEYQPVETVQLYYRGALQDFDDRLQDLSVRGTSHAGRVTYGQSLRDQKVQLSAEYNVLYQETEVIAGGPGEVVTALFPLRGLSEISDTPDRVTLVPNPPLIDGDRTASASVNLGLPPLGGDDRPRNLGLELASAASLNTLFLWVDRDISLDIANSFSWDVYTSADNLNWSFQQTVFPADFQVFERRFEVRFATLATRYIKVVVLPLSRSIPGAGSFPDILVTELSAGLRTPAEEARGRSSQTTQYLSSSARVRLLKNPSLEYEMSVYARDEASAATTYILSNGFSLRHVFNPVYSLTARVAREDSREPEGDQTSYLYTAAVRAVPYPTFQSSLIFSGRTTDFNGRSSDGASVFLYSSAEIYRGVNATLGLGHSAATEADGTHTENNRVNAQATLVPHRTVALNLLYQDNTGTTRGGTLAGEQRSGIRAQQASFTYRPLSALYFFFSHRAEQPARGAERFIRNYSMSWSPFPDGSLQVQVSYDDAFRSDTQARSRIFSPRVRWNITDRWYAELAYQRTDFASDVQKRAADSLSANMRFVF